MIAALGWCPLQQERTEDKLMMIYRDNGLIDVPADQFLRPATLSIRGQIHVSAACCRLVERMCPVSS